ncbi:MAG: hypothetical protein DRO11_09590 [Methanobacteriota archaeon]|nr:MAG: hypothetical protein DRO11_09590 [Euryarchaeota archaeon]
MNKKFAKLLADGENVTITCPKGTRLELRIAGRLPKVENCSLSREEPWFQLPGGEVCIAPLENSCEGTAIFSGKAIGLPEDVEIFFENGKTKKIDSQLDEKILSLLASSLGVPGETMGELGIGTNPGAKPIPTGPILEKALGTIHLGMGDNTQFGGKHESNTHNDLIIEKPTLVVDNRVIIENGEPKI